MFDKLKCAISILCLAVVLVLVLGGQVLANIPGMNLSKTCVILNFESVIILINEQPNYTISWSFVRVH